MATRKTALAALACIALAGIAVRAIAAEAPSIIGPTDIQPGDLAVFRVMPATKGTWKVWPKEAESHALPVLLPEGGTALVFASRIAQTVVVVFAYPVMEGETAAALMHECRNGSPKPDPPKPDPPKPDPPKPDPPKPDPSGLTKTIVWIEETAERSAGQAEAIADPESRRAIAAAGWRLRIMDKDVLDEQGRRPAEWTAIIDAAVARGLPIVLVADANGKTTWYRAPEGAAQMRALLAEIGIRATVPAAGTLWPTPRRTCPPGGCY